jgi:hypothetical protein
VSTLQQRKKCTEKRKSRFDPISASISQAQITSPLPEAVPPALPSATMTALVKRAVKVSRHSLSPAGHQFCDDLILIVTISVPPSTPFQFFLHKTFGHFLKEKLDLSQLDIDFKAGIVHLTHLELNNEVTCHGFYALRLISHLRWRCAPPAPTRSSASSPFVSFLHVRLVLL